MLTIRVNGNRLEVWQGDRLIRTTTVTALFDVTQAIHRGRTELTL